MVELKWEVKEIVRIWENISEYIPPDKFEGTLTTKVWMKIYQYYFLKKSIEWAEMKGQVEEHETN